MAVRDEAGVHVVMKPIVESVGLDWAAQRRRIASHPVLAEGMALQAIPSAGGMQEATTLHLEQFHGWLVTLTPDRIKDEVKRELVIRYQRSAFRVIFEHFHGPIGREPPRRPVAEQIALQRELLSVMRKLQQSHNRAERQTMHRLLDGMCGELGIDTFSLSDPGRPPGLSKAAITSAGNT